VTREEARLDWSMPARELERRVRAFDPAPGAWTTLAGAPLRIWQARALEGTSAPPGQVLCADRQGVRVATGEGDLLVKRLQLAGGRPVAVADYLNAHRAPVGQTLGH
jgi:methionyl-tRNA formyltransferase